MNRPADADRIRMFSFTVFSKLEGAVTAGMIHLGDRLGLYRCLADIGPSTTDELAAALRLDERWVREWAHNQAAARLIEVVVPEADPSEPERFRLTDEAVAVLVDEDHPAFGMGMFHRLPQTLGALERLPEAFRTGRGFDYDSHGPEGAVGIERSFEPWCSANLIDTVMPALERSAPGLHRRLSAGGSIIDVGCGSGGAILALAAAYGASTCTGFDISGFALERAAERLAERSLSNVSFFDPRSRSIPGDGSVDLAITFDCLHDMTRPDAVARDLRAALGDDGVWLIAEIKALDTFAENVERNPMASLMYGISVLTCMASALSEPDGAGLGTMGLPESRLRALVADAGFTRFERLDVEHAVNAFYVVRP
jgi:SAM-dependent methyltransferase